MSSDLKKQLDLARRRSARYKAAARESERLLEEKSRQLFKTNEELKDIQANLADQVKQRTAELRKANRKLQTASRHKSEFLAICSHELRTPLNAIIGLSELLLKEKPSVRQTDYLLTIQTATQSLLYMINDILDFSKIEAGKMEIAKQVFNPVEQLTQLSRLFEFQANDKSLKLQVRIDDNVPPYIESDLNRFKQIAINLISNAIKFTPTGGVRIRLTYREPLLSIRVTDTGSGIDKEKLEQIFEAFEQVSAVEGGTGLGLSITNKLCSLMGGQIICWSKANFGSVFTASIKVNQAQHTVDNRQMKQDRHQASGQQKILVAEDNLTNQKVIRSQLEALGHTVTLVDDGEQAMQTLQKQSFDLLILDNQMPVLDGINTLKAVRNSGSGIADLPVIALTANAFAGEKERFLASGFDAYLSKPVLLDELATTIGQLVQPGPECVPKKVIDETYFKKQFGENAQLITAQLVPIFIEQTEKDLRLLKQAVTTQNSQQVKITSHSIKGAAASVGAMPMCDTLTMLETSSDAAEQSDLLADIVKLFSQTRSALQHMISNGE